MLQGVMWENCGVERDARGLERGRERLEEMGREVLPCMTIHEQCPNDSLGAYPQGLQEALEVRMMMELGKLVLASALFRKETRGHHMRVDYPSSAGEPVHTLVAKGRDPRPREVNRRGTGR
jgi:succinate dehydrogenase/fumarate reductase flavoprotein subunit